MLSAMSYLLYVYFPTFFLLAFLLLLPSVTLSCQILRNLTSFFTMTNVNIISHTPKQWPSSSPQCLFLWPLWGDGTSHQAWGQCECHGPVAVHASTRSCLKVTGGGKPLLPMVAQKELSVICGMLSYWNFEKCWKKQTVILTSLCSFSVFSPVGVLPPPGPWCWSYTAQLPLQVCNRCCPHQGAPRTTLLWVPPISR